MTTPKRGVQAILEVPVTRPDGKGGWVTLGPVRLVRKHKPRNGGATLGEFTNIDGRGVQRAMEYAREKGHTVGEQR